jgi:hypothetical protein
MFFFIVFGHRAAPSPGLHPNPMDEGSNETKEERKRITLYYRFTHPVTPPLSLQEAIFEHLSEQEPFRRLNLSYEKISLLEDCFLRLELRRKRLDKPILFSKLDEPSYSAFSFKTQDSDGTTFWVEIQIVDPDSRRMLRVLQEEVF